MITYRKLSSSQGVWVNLVQLLKFLQVSFVQYLFLGAWSEKVLITIYFHQIQREIDSEDM